MQPVMFGGPNLIFRVRGEARRAKPEAKMADSGGGVLEEGEVSPSLPARRSG